MHDHASGENVHPPVLSYSTGRPPDAEFIRSCPAPLFAADEAGVITLWNAAAARLLELPESEALHRAPAFSFEAGTFADYCRRIQLGDAVSSVDATLRLPDGQHRILSLAGAPRLNDAGEVCGSVWSLEDITPQRQVRSDLRYVISRANCILWHAVVTVDPAFITGYDWKMEVFNEEAAKRFLPLAMQPGWSYAEAWFRSKHPDDIARSDEVFAAAIEDHLAGYTQEFRCRRQDGDLRTLSEETSIEELAPGRWRVAAVVTDVTESRRYHEELRDVLIHANCLLWHAVVRQGDSPRELHWTYRVFDEASAQAFLPVDMQWGNYLDGWYNAKHPDDRARLDDNFHDAIVNGSSRFRQEFRVRDATGSLRWIDEQVTLEPLEPGLWRVVSVNVDATERKRVEEQMHALNHELERRVRERTALLEAANRELEAFAYSISHDLRGPLRSIDGFSKLVLEDYSDRLDSTAQQYLERVRASSQQLGRLMDALLGLSRVSRGEMSFEEVNLSTLADSIVTDLRSMGERRPVEVDIQPNLAAQGSPHLLRIALENLLSNAWKFSEGRPDARIEFGGRWEEGAQIYWIRDNGAGFDMQYAHKLFAPFQRLHTSEEFAGTGIGLASVERIVRRHGGRIWAEGSPGVGAAFFFTLE